MYGRFQHLSAFGKKFLEVCGAGLASAVVACLIGQTDKAESPLAPVVYLAPADAQMMKLMHDDQSALLERLRTARGNGGGTGYRCQRYSRNRAGCRAGAGTAGRSGRARPPGRKAQPRARSGCGQAAARGRTGDSENGHRIDQRGIQRPAAASSRGAAAFGATEYRTGDFARDFRRRGGGRLGFLAQADPRLVLARRRRRLVSAAPRPPMPVGNLLPHMM